jgi:outer membrane protein
MKLRRSFQLFLAIGFMVFAANSLADVKLGYIRVEKIMQDSPQAVEIGKKLQKEFASRGSELESMGKRLNDQAAALDKNSPVMSENDRRVKEQDLSNSNIEFQRKQRELSEDIDLRKKQELTSLQELINKAVKTVSQKEGYDLVLYGNIAYAGKAIDITDKVIKALGSK